LFHQLAERPKFLLASRSSTPLRQLSSRLLVAGNAQRPDVVDRALTATLDDRHNMVGVPEGDAMRRNAELPPRTAVGTRPFWVIGGYLIDAPFQLLGIEPAFSTDALIAPKDALPHQTRAVTNRPIVDAAITTEGPASLWDLGAAIPTERAAIRPFG
jgi:hypothetical protein